MSCSADSGELACIGSWSGWHYLRYCDKSLILSSWWATYCLGYQWSAADGNYLLQRHSQLVGKRYRQERFWSPQVTWGYRENTFCTPKLHMWESVLGRCLGEVGPCWPWFVWVCKRMGKQPRPSFWMLFLKRLLFYLLSDTSKLTN